MLKIRKVSDRNRSKFEIIAEILRHLNLPKKKTNIMSHCNMSTAQSGQYLNIMTTNNLIQLDSILGKVTYQRTETGKRFLELYSKMALLLDPSMPPPF